jgi:hypothetical protein
MGPMADVRTCEQCGALFTPSREHARFCSARCRVAWNQENLGDPKAETSALDWSITAMRDAVDQLAANLAPNPTHGLTLVSDAVWLVTIVDATLVRYHQQAYDSVIEAAADRRSIEGTFAGLRFVRNQMGYHLDPADFAQPAPHRPGADPGRVTAWTWRSLPEPDLSTLPPRGQAWEMTRYRAYQAQLAGHRVGDTFSRAVEFLTLASVNLTAA